MGKKKYIVNVPVKTKKIYCETWEEVDAIMEREQKKTPCRLTWTFTKQYEDQLNKEMGQ